MLPLPVPLRDDSVTLRDGRRLAWAEWGDPGGAPLLFFHGSPGTRLTVPDPTPAADRGVRVITIDRPGYSRSDPQPGRTLGSWADDVGELADRLALDRFAIFGFSSGGPHALVCGVHIPDRVTRIGIGGMGVTTDMLPPLLDRLDEEQRERLRLWDQRPEEALRRTAADQQSFGRRVREILQGPGVPPGDRRVVEDLGYLELIATTYAAAVADGGVASAWDERVCVKPWGFRLEEVDVPVHVWHGEQDPLVTGDEISYLARHLSDVRVTVLPDEGHAAVFSRWPAIISALVDQHDRH